MINAVEFQCRSTFPIGFSNQAAPFGESVIVHPRCDLPDGHTGRHTSHSESGELTWGNEAITEIACSEGSLSNA